MARLQLPPQREDLEAAIARRSQRLEAMIQPYAMHVERPQNLPGGNREAVETLIAEIGAEMRRFLSAAHLASWAIICPEHHPSAGKRKTGRPRPTQLGAQQARRGRRRGKKKAALAVGHIILVAASYILRAGVLYHDQGPEPRDRLARSLLASYYVQRLEQLGHRVTLEQGADVAQGCVGFLGKPVFNLLKGYCKVWVVNAAHVKVVPGRKTDDADAQWLARLLRYGLLQRRFIPPAGHRDARDWTRYRTQLVQERSREINRVQGVLERANFKLAGVATKIS